MSLLNLLPIILPQEVIDEQNTLITILIIQINLLKENLWKFFMAMVKRIKFFIDAEIEF